ncbi:MAG: hypothetical protein JWQ27_2973 [Ferruginibacter sp.]|nr:hypothetical protein [Ferruginibacter sp.]
MSIFKKKLRIPKDQALPIQNDRRMLNKAVVFISSFNTTKSFGQISKEVFNDWEGTGLDQYLVGILLELASDGYIEEHISGNSFTNTKSYSITGKGKKFCNAPFLFFKRSPYTYEKFVKILGNGFFKLLPILISTLSLIIAILSYLSSHKTGK